VTPSAQGSLSEAKIQQWHRDRLAVVYVRQSTRQQVIDHGESTRLQYGLVDRAAGLGWARSRVLVIDEDLGRSGASAVDRTGFQRLVTEVTMDHVGLVLGIEMSRLARAGRDWHQLLELCALSRTLLADGDGVYDPNDYNDRMLLGLKGVVSEVELHLIKTRMRSGVLAKASRGELVLPLPMGFLRRPSGEVVLDPDEGVQETVRLVFRLFTELGTVNAVLRALVTAAVAMPVRVHDGPDKGDLAWRRPNRVSLQNMLRNPAYAGIYVYGRSREDARRRRPGHPCSGRTRVAEEDWLVRLPDRLPAYISVAEHERILARLAANQARADTPGAARDGAGLLGGLAVCGKCQRRMTVRYARSAGRDRHCYLCARQKIEYGLSACQQMSGAFLDAWVIGQVLDVVAPAAVELSTEATLRIQREREQLERVWKLRIERAQIACDRARRCYRLTEPENRLVARQLEAEWEAALAEHQRLVEDHRRFLASQPAALGPGELAAIAALARDVPAIWNAASTTNADRKELLRCLLERVVVTAEGDSEKVHVQLVWAGGATTSADLVRPVAHLEQLSYFPLLRQRVAALAAQGLAAAAIAEQINTEGLRPPKRADHFTADTMRELMHRLGISPRTARRRPQAPGPDQWWLKDLAHEIGMPPVTLYSWVQRGWVTASQDTRAPYRWIVHAAPAEVDRLRALHALPAGHHNRQRWTPRPLTEEGL
jgi:DNA invertase Pin-like site-specific DNA recombinase